MTITEMANALLEQAEESGTGFLTYADAEALLNRALRELAVLTNYYTHSYSLTANGSRYYNLTALSGNFLSLLSVHDGNDWLSPRSETELRAYSPDWHTEVGTPTGYMVKGLHTLFLFPNPASGTFTLLVSEIPSDLPFTGTPPPPPPVRPAPYIESPFLPVHFHEQLIDGALALHYLDEKEVGKYDLFNQRWQATIQAVREWHNGRLDYVRTAVVGGA